jgi:UDP-N-acetylglucosamine--N-acetylmuramyl-(pentapeptide) pyrophosphoryl-undecaprenol N-acetylglucosamine transferase
MTGGGVYPAITVLQALESSLDEVLWIGSQSGMEETLLKSYDLAYQSIPAAGLHGVGLHALPGNLAQLYKGWRQAKRILARFKPHALFFTGGYIGVPVALAGRHIPSVVFVPDVEPGLALKTILRSADKIAVSCPDSLRYVSSEHAVVSGYPVRGEMLRWKRKQAREHFGIPEKEFVLLVFGGSKGARSINQALLGCLPSLLKDMHVIHISGRDNWQDVHAASDALSSTEKKRYHAFAFLHEDIGAAFAAADLAVCRAGASTLGELPAFGLPAVLVPYPYAWRYQQQNAAYLQRQGGAVMLEDGLLERRLEWQIRQLFNDPKQLDQMRKSIRSASSGNAAERIAKLIVSIGGKRKGVA